MDGPGKPGHDGGGMNPLLSQFVVAVPIGLGSAWLALIKFQAQRRWERKEDAYKEVLEALHEMRQSNDVLYEAELGRWELPDERLKSLHERWRDGQRVVYKFADIGSVVLSPEAEKILISLKAGLEGHFDSYFEELDADFGHLRSAMTAMKRVALADRQRLVWWKLKSATSLDCVGNPQST
jgi:hypothetical protein